MKSVSVPGAGLNQLARTIRELLEEHGHDPARRHEWLLSAFLPNDPGFAACRRLQITIEISGEPK